MRILQTTDTLGGVWTYAVELSAALARQGVEVVLATMGPRLSDDQRAELAGVPGLAAYESAFRLEWMDDPWEDVRLAGEWLLDIAATTRPDLVHLNMYAHARLPWETPLLVVGHSCVLSWWEAVRGGAAPPEWDRYRREVTAGLRAADLVVAPSASMLYSLRHHYGPLHHSQVIANGLSGTPGPAAKEPLILAAGRIWDEAKNLAALDAVAPRLSWPVYIAGAQRHPEGGNLELRHARGLGRLTRSALRERMSSAAIYALPARYEPFGLSALEAAWAGCALVLGDIPSLREVWGRAALYVAPDDHAGLAEALNMLAADESQRLALARQAERRARLYTADRMAASYLAAYWELARHSARAGARLAAGHTTGR